MKRIQGFPSPHKDFYKVYVRTITYNQSRYIEDCLNGVAMQKTDFPFVHHVIDDASTDGEQEVIKAWMNRECNMDKAEYYDNVLCTISIAKKKNNSNCTVVAYFLKKNLFKEPKKKDELYQLWRDVCPYEALCEGDDYWICPDKLQKQVDILEKDASVGMVYTYARMFDQQKCALSERIVGRDGCSFEEILLQNPVPTVTTIYRTELYERYLKDINSFPKKWVMGDMPMWLYFAAESKAVFLPDITAVYRVLPVSAYHNPDVNKEIRMSLGSFDICVFFAERYNRQDMLPQIKKQHVTSMIYKYLTHNEPVDISACHKVGRIRDSGFKVMIYTLLSLYPITRKKLYRYITKQ